ncbi:phosphotransferase [Glaciecola petra]|uniref:Phosphotransferase n=1 Tax=Glaciecola petra TaxID=3075602 RepID=A0ABU2ZTZ9_9ALTE|nr:phosphotransferase [Aestuariibacter sp. P117]MDT0595881.1 phosphotransferase [Aestuariibacter sp. P117]
MKFNVLHYLQDFYTDSKISKLEKVQSLWSDYGEIARYWVPSIDSSIIVKVINIQQQNNHPRGWNTDISHQRKLSSYQNELNFYRHFSSISNSLISSTTINKQKVPICKVPTLIDSHTNEDSIFLILEDLDCRKYVVRHSIGNMQNAKIGLTWLAYFHAAFLQCGSSGKNNGKYTDNKAISISPDLSLVWPHGNYWHLKTRPDEFTAMPEGELKNAAKHIDEKLRQTQYQCLLHGDAKLANFCFHKNNKNVAAVDFQYTGKGAGIIDVVYFLGSCFDDDDLSKNAAALLNFYFEQLASAIDDVLDTNQKQTLEKEWRDLYAFAWADFERFLQGWSPQHKKLTQYSQMQTQIALSGL